MTMHWARGITDMVRDTGWLSVYKTEASFIEAKSRPIKIWLPDPQERAEKLCLGRSHSLLALRSRIFS